MAGQIRAVYDQAPPFPASDQHPEAVRYQVSGRWVDAVGGQPTPAEVNALLAGPPMPDFGADVETEDAWRPKAIEAVSNLRAYLALQNPTNAQTVAAFRVLVRVVLFLVRRSL